MLWKRGLLLLALVVLVPYARPPAYHFPEPAVFSGATLLNPYAEATPVWRRANLHAHAWAWNGLTNGRQTAQEIVDTYRRRGYAVAAVSDYHSIAANDGVDTLPVYEHGYNIDKRHQLAIGARSVEWFDFPLWQSLADEQFVIDEVRAKSGLVALAHPTARDAYSLDDLRHLTGYQLLEVVNGPFVAEDSWDAALSSGHLIWAIADDDTHDLNDPRRSAVAWNMIGAATASTGDVVQALRMGRTYAVMRTDEDPSPVEAVVPQVAVSGDTLTVSAGEPSTFLFIGQGGDVRKTIKQATEAAYTFTPADTYIRTVVRSPRTATFVNPIVRWDGEHVPSPAAVENVTGTWLWRGLYLLAAAAIVTIVLRRREPRRGPAPVLLADRRQKRA